MKTIFSILLLLLVVNAFASAVYLKHRRAAFTSASYTPYAADFPGDNDYGEINAELTGATDGAVGTFSCWIDITGGDGTERQIIWSSAQRLEIVISPSNTVYMVHKNNGGSPGAEMSSSVTKTASDGWFHVLIVWDNTTSGNNKIYFDGVEDTSKDLITVSDAADLDWTRPQWRMGAGNSAANDLFASLSELWLDDTYNDSVSDYYNAGQPVDLGSDGSTPTGTGPVVYLSRNGSGESWLVDSGPNGNNWETNGTINAVSPPP